MTERKTKSKKRRARKKTGWIDNADQSDASEPTVFLNIKKSEQRLFATSILIIIALVFAAHTITIWGQFVYLDLYNLSELRHTRDWSKFWSDLMLSSMVSPLNEPLVKVSLALDVLSMGIRSPGIFHAINMLLHMANSILLYFLVRRLAVYTKLKEQFAIEADLAAFASVAIFACHPLGCGAISYISARSALLVVLNYMISLHFFMTGFLSKGIMKALFCYGFSYLFVLFGIWSGPQAVTISGAFIVLALLMKPAKESYKSWVMDRPFEFFAQLLVAIGVPMVLLLNFIPLVGNGFGVKTLPLQDYVATQFKVLVTYILRCFFIPYGLSLDPPLSIANSLLDPFTILGILTVILSFIGAYRLRANLIPAFAISLFVLSLIPSCFVPHPEYVSITRIYFTMASLSILSGYYLARFSVLKPMTCMIVSSLILVGLVGLSNYRNWQWHKDIRLWKSALDMNSQSKRSLSMYAWALEFNGKLEDGYKIAKKAYKTDKDNVILDLILGTYYLSEKKHKESYKYFKEGVNLAEKQNLSREILYKLQSGFAEAAMKEGKFDEALKYADKAMRIQKSAKLFYIQGVCYMSQDNPQGAFMKLQDSYLLDKYNPELIEPLTRAALGCGTKKLQDLAYKMSMQAYKVHGSNPRMALLRAYASLETGRVNESLKFIKTFLETQKPTDESLYLLYGANKKLGRTKEAKMFLDLALSVNPNIRKEMRLYLNRDLVQIKNKENKIKEKDGESKGSGKE